MKIVILDGYTTNPNDLSWEGLEKYGDVEVYSRTAPDETVARATGAECVLTNKVVIGRREMERLPLLRYIGVTGTGYNVVDVEEAHRRGIVVTNVPAYSTDSVAQMVFAHLLTVTNRVEHYTNANHHGRWVTSDDFCYWDTPLIELAGKTFGIVGLGNIGRRVAQIAQAFGMNVVALTSKSEEMLPDGVRKADLPTLFAESDVVSLHCPLTEETRQIINSRTIAMMKPGSILINTGRGPLVDDDAVAEALNDDRLYAYCADVLTTEPPSISNPLLKAKNAYITPHIAWATKEARKRLIDVITDNIRAFVSGAPQNVV